MGVVATGTHVHGVHNHHRTDKPPSPRARHPPGRRTILRLGYTFSRRATLLLVDLALDGPLVDADAPVLRIQESGEALLVPHTQRGDAFVLHRNSCSVYTVCHGT